MTKKFHNAKRIALVGVGSELRGDDAAGILVAREFLKNKIKSLKVFLGETAPENITGQIKKYKPTHIIIVDSADMKERPGKVKLFEVDQIAGITFSTHQLSLKMMVDYLSNFFKFDCVVLGIQPKCIQFGSEISKEVLKAVKTAATLIKKLI
jgi:hydrogenase maturation protease HycI